MKFSRLFRKSLIALSLVGMATSFSGRSANAATETGTLTVTADVEPSCLISTAPVNFGSYNPLTTHTAGNPLDSTGSVIIRCASGLPVNVRLGQSFVPVGGSTDDAPLRQMVGPTPADLLDYNLYSDAPGGTVWGNSAVSDVASLGTGADVTLTIHGRIPGGQNRASGTYTDTVTAAVDF
jgi:spore coat protein U-like protein